MSFVRSPAARGLALVMVQFWSEGASSIVPVLVTTVFGDNGGHGVLQDVNRGVQKKKQSAIAAQLNIQRTFIFHQGKASQIR